MHGRKKGRRLLRLLLLAALLLTGYLLWERPPAKREKTPAPGESEPAQAELVETAAVPAGRKKGVYTLLLAGRDDSSGNTDTLLLGRLDTAAHSLDLVSLPRDTLVNLDWSVRKLNAVYAGTANSGGVAGEGLLREVRRLCGFFPDVYATVDLDVFAEAVDLVGGIDYELPWDMDYDDPWQDLHIHLKAGPQHLDGAQAAGVVRYRSGYLNGDLDRLEQQHAFLKTALAQLLRIGSIPRLPELAALITERTDSDLTAANVAWLARQLLLCKSEDIRFHTMPTVPVTLQGLSYAVVDLEPWLAILNDCLDPYATPVRAENLDLVYRADGVYCATSGLLCGAEYYG